ncbi:MAG: hypothetical protein ACRDSF_00065 [Pseudonocardiaceae bacterium]
MRRKGNFGSETRQTILANRREKLLRLRRAGYSIREIAPKIPEYGGDTLEAREKAIRADLRRILRRMIDEPARELLALQYARYERLLRALYVEALKGDLQATDRVLTLLRNQSKLIQSMGSSGSTEGSDVDKWLNSLMDDVSEAESEDISDDY